MKKLKLLCNWFLRVGLSAIVVMFLLLAPFTLFPNLLTMQSDVNKKENYEYQGVLELWHIETFEGGSVSRGSFLQKEAINFEKEHKGTYIIIQTMNAEQFALNISEGKMPNIVSFGVGVADKITNNLVELDTAGIRTDLKEYGKQNSKQLAIPYILGGYALITQNLENSSIQEQVGVGLKGLNNPLKALSENNIKIENVFPFDDMDSYDAYDKFLKNNFSILLGTQRDVYRIVNRQQKGLMQDVKFQLLGGYSDLVQYLSVVKSTNIEEKLCREFVERMISLEVQNKLKDYNLFSVRSDVTLYSDGIYRDFELVLKEKLSSENAFISSAQINLQKEESYNLVVKTNLS